MTPAGAETGVFPLSTAGDSIATGPDGNLWFTERAGVGRITPSGNITEFPTPSGSYVGSIAAGPDGNLWFTEDSFGHLSAGIGRITPSGTITEFPIPSAVSGSIAAGPDGNLWFTEDSGSGTGIGTGIGRITPSGNITQFPTPQLQFLLPGGIAARSDANIWFIEESRFNKIGRIAPAGAMIEIAIPTANSQPVAITVGPDGNLWFTESATSKIGKLRP